MPEERKVKILVKDGTVKCDPFTIGVNGGDTIVWELKGKESRPLSIIVKCFVSPLSWGYKVKKGRVIRVAVRRNAVRGIYPYAVCVCDGDDLLVADPEIIVPKPKGGK